MNKNKGFSLFEMVLVMAIVSIMALMVTISIGTIRRNSVYRTSEKLETYINQARTTALTKGTDNGYLNIARFDDGVYVFVGTKLTSSNEVKSKGEKICSGDIQIATNAPKDGSDSGGVISSGEVRHIGFAQSTGGVSTIQKIAKNEGDGDDVPAPKYITIMVSKGASSSTFYIARFTGKIVYSI